MTRSKTQECESGFRLLVRNRFFQIDSEVRQLSQPEDVTQLPAAQWGSLRIMDVYPGLTTGAIICRLFEAENHGLTGLRAFVRGDG